ncbi:MAG: hypothetical protein ACAF41_25345 [Leptolyngbya sp. BL-A-14]
MQTKIILETVKLVDFSLAPIDLEGSRKQQQQQPFSPMTKLHIETL